MRGYPMSPARRQQLADRKSNVEYGAMQPPPPIEAYMPNCKEVRQGDELFCPPCGLRWDASEDRPTCLRDRR